MRLLLACKSAIVPNTGQVGFTLQSANFNLAETDKFSFNQNEIQL
jgi:hypothetical protein